MLQLPLRRANALLKSQNAYLYGAAIATLILVTTYGQKSNKNNYGSSNALLASGTCSAGRC